MKINNKIYIYTASTDSDCRFEQDHVDHMLNSQNNRFVKIDESDYKSFDEIGSVTLD